MKGGDYMRYVNMTFDVVWVDGNTPVDPSAYKPNGSRVIDERTGAICDINKLIRSRHVIVIVPRQVAETIDSSLAEYVRVPGNQTKFGGYFAQLSEAV